MLLWLTTLGMWYIQYRNSNKQMKSEDEHLPPELLIRGGQAIKEVQKAVENQNLDAVRTSLLAWARTNWIDNPPLSLQALGSREKLLGKSLENLDRHRYAREPVEWDGKEFLIQFRKVVKMRDTKTDSQGANLIRDLYPGSVV